jgi:hypothetical protein
MTAMITHRWYMSVDQWPQSLIHVAVYNSEGSENWQQFRVSMKGQSTRMKLVRLRQWYIDYCMHLASETDERSMMVHKLNKCRIDNYIGALVRGGQLNSNLEVVR